MNSSLSQPALDVIQAYETLTFGSNEVMCPYFNNKRQKVRGALKALIGKGSPIEIAEEATILALRKHIDLRKADPEIIKTFLVDNNLGVDCSGFVYHVLDAEMKATRGKALKKVLKFPYATSLLRKLLTKLRPVENTNVKTLAHEKNATSIALSEIHAGDFITMIGSKKIGNPDHILLVESVVGTLITLVHAFKLPKDGKYNHGIKHCTVKITDSNKSILEQEWDDSDMLAAVKDAELVEVKKLK